MLKRSLLRAGALAALLSLSGCNDAAYLTETPYDFVGPENFYKTAGDANAAIAGVYASALHTSGDGYYGRNFIMLSEFLTEMQTVYLSVANERSLVDNYTFTASHAYIFTTWQGAYQAINRANSVIDRVPLINMDANLRARIVAEAQFLRALHYTNLVRLFGDVPLRTRETTSIDSLTAPRAPADSVYAQIIRDLTAAAAVLPGRTGYTGADIGRATRGAAKTLLAKAYLHRATATPGATRAADLAEARRLLAEVRTQEGYALVSDFATLFDGVNENNTEVIYDIQCSRSNGIGCRLSNQVAPRLSNYGSSQNGSFSAEQPFFNEYATTDRRRAVTWQLSYTNKANNTAVWTINTTTLRNGGYVANGVTTDTTIAPVMGKFLDRLSTAAGNDEPNYIILRYGDNLLMEAEVVNELSGPVAEAYTPINAVRARAGLPNLVAGLSQAAFRDSVFAQRRLELAMEGPNGIFDTQRNWNWAKTRIEANMAFARTINFRSSRYPKAQTALVDKFKLLPIPQRARDLNPLLTQNPGW